MKEVRGRRLAASLVRRHTKPESGIPPRGEMSVIFVQTKSMRVSGTPLSRDKPAPLEYEQFSSASAIPAKGNRSEE